MVKPMVTAMEPYGSGHGHAAEVPAPPHRRTPGGNMPVRPWSSQRRRRSQASVDSAIEECFKADDRRQRSFGDDNGRAKSNERFLT